VESDPSSYAGLLAGYLPNAFADGRSISGGEGAELRYDESPFEGGGHGLAPGLRSYGCPMVRTRAVCRAASGINETPMRFTRITVDPKQMGGVPCIRGLRIPVATLVAMVADGMAENEILTAYPDLERDDISGALHYAAEAVRERELPLVRA
jgi:uncharacterized protein (DUF433 family)